MQKISFSCLLGCILLISYTRHCDSFKWNAKAATLKGHENERNCGQNIYGDSSNYYTDNLESKRTSELELSKRIVSGQSSRVGEWPWLVSLRLRYNDGKSMHICGGTLIHPQWVLTAKHCTEPIKWKEMIFAETTRWTIRVGEHDMSNEDVPHLDLEVAEMINHEKYKLPRDDIALIKLKQPVPLSKYVNIACLPHKDETFAPGTMCTVAGWGLNATGVLSKQPFILQHTNVPIVSNKECFNAYKNDVDEMPDSNICAGAPNEGPCQGDSGGPLMCLMGSRWELAGIVSYSGEICAKEGKPGVFARVSSYLRWIKSAMKAAI